MPSRKTQGRHRIVLGVPLALAVAYAVLVIVFDTFELPGASYYATAAQVIPVLIVALALEGPVRRALSGSGAATTWLRRQLFVFLLIGEAAAFLGMSGALGRQKSSGDVLNADTAEATSQGVQEGMVAATSFLSNLLCGLTGAGLINGFLVVVSVAIFGFEDAETTDG